MCKPIFVWDNYDFYHEQEILDCRDCDAIFYYCSSSRGRWAEAENKIVKSAWAGYSYAIWVSRKRYDMDIEQLYFENCENIFLKWYVLEYVKYGNI